MSEISNLNLFQYVFDWHNDNVFSKLTNPLSIISEKEEYCHDILMLLFKIDSAFNDLDLNKKFVCQYQNKDLFEILDIDKSTYLNYHLEYFYLKISTIYDLSLKLINAIYKLNLNGMKINYKNIIKCESVSVDIKGLVINFNNKIVSVRVIRNDITHSNELNEDNIERLKLTKHLKENSKNESIKKLISKIGVLIDDQAYNNIQEFMSNTEQITFEYLKKLFNHLNGRFSNYIN